MASINGVSGGIINSNIYTGGPLEDVLAVNNSVGAYSIDSTGQPIYAMEVQTNTLNALGVGTHIQTETDLKISPGHRVDFDGEISVYKSGFPFLTSDASDNVYLTLNSSSSSYVVSYDVSSNRIAYMLGGGGGVGPTGPAGPAGVAGDAGPTGPTGPAGDVGATGPAGDVGATGPAGPTGPAGDVGATGPAGPTGPAGDVGATGPAGVAGEAGPTGPAGVAGEAGPTGPAGVAGEAGPTGPAGETGATGPAGSSGEIARTYYANLGTDDLQTQINLLNVIGGTREQLIISPGSWVPPSPLLLNNKDTVSLVGSESFSPLTRITQALTISGVSSTRNQFNNLSFDGNITIDGTQGRHRYYKCDFLKNFTFTNSMSNFISFDNCEFAGVITVPITFGGIIYFNQCNFAGATFNLNNPMAGQVNLALCLNIPASLNVAKATLIDFNIYDSTPRMDTVDLNAVSINATDATFTTGGTNILVDSASVKGIEIQSGASVGRFKVVNNNGDYTESLNTSKDIFHSGATDQTNRYIQLRDNNGNQVDLYAGSSVPTHPATNGSLFVLTGLSPNIYQRGPSGWSSIVPTSAVPSQRVLSIGKNVDMVGILAGSPYQIQWNTQQFEQNSLGYFRWPNPNNPRAGASTVLIEKTATYLLNCSLAIQYPTSLPAQASFELYIRVYDSAGTLTDNLIDAVDIVPQTSPPSRTYFTLQISKYKQLNINDRLEVFIASNTANTSTVFGTSLYADQTYLQISIVD